MEDFDKYLDQLVENFFDTGKLVLNETIDTINWDKIGKVIRDPNKSEQIYELLIDMFPNAKEVIDYNYYGDNEEPSPNDTFAEMKSFLWNIDKNTIKGPDLRLSTGFEIDGEYKKDLEKKYDDYVGGKIDKYFRDSSNDPRDTTKEGFKNLPPILVMGKKVIDGNHRTFLAQKVGAELPTFEMVEEPNTHPNAQKILSIIHPNDSDEDGIPNRLDISQEPNLNEHDSILDRIVEEFFDTGKLVLNEYSDNISSFFLQSKDANVNRINANKKLNGLDRLDKLIESAIEWDKVIDILGKMDDNELSKISRGGDNEWLTFKFANNLKGISNINDAVKVLQSQYYNEIKKYYYELINNIHRDSKTSENIEEIIGRYEKLKVLIEKLCSKTSYEKFLEVECQKMKGRLDDNIIRNSILINDWISKYKKIKTLYYENRSSMDYIKNIEDYIKNLEDLKVDYSLLPPKKKGEIIYYFKFHFDNKGGFGFNVENFVDWIDNTINNQEKLKNKDYKVRNTDLIGLDVLGDYLTYKSSITPEQSEESFDKIVDDIGVEIVEDEDFPDILSNYVIDDELLEQRKDILGKIKNINSKIKNINDKIKQLKNVGNENWENEGKTKLPQYKNEKENLEEQLRIIDPIKALFDSDSGWGDNYINCRPKEISDNPTNKILEEKSNYSKYLKSYYGTLPKAHKALLNRQQIAAVNKPNTQRGTINCKKYNLKNLTTEIGRDPNRVDIKNELTNNFTEYSENNDITNLLNKSINLVDNIFKTIFREGILTNIPLQKYKSFINMIKIYSRGENTKQKLLQLVYDLNQLNNVVESYDTLSGTATSPQSSDEEDGQEEGTKLLSKTKLKSLLNDIIKNSYDKEKIKDYFVKVREHNNVAYEKSFEKECNDTKYFKKAKGDNPRIVDINSNNTHLVEYILSADTENNYITTEKVVETIFGEVKDLLNNENAIKNRLKKYDLKVLSSVTLIQKNGDEEIELLPSEEKYIEVKDTKPGDYHFSEFFGVYKNTDTLAYRRMKNLTDDEETDEHENFERYNEFVEGLVDKLISIEGEQIINIIKSKLQGVFFEKYEFCPIDNIRFTWSTVGQGKKGGREKRVTIRIEPIDYDEIYVWKEGNSNCSKRQYFEGCEENSGCPQNESTDRIDNIIENFFDTGKFDV